MSNLPPDIAETLRRVQNYMPQMERDELEAALLAYSLFFLRMTNAANELINGLPEEKPTDLTGWFKL